jgi:hypothetical protein
LLFDTENPINRKGGERYLFTTEGHIFPISSKIREKVWNDDFMDEDDHNLNVNEKIHYSSDAFAMSPGEHSRLLKNGDTVYDARYTSDNMTKSRTDHLFQSNFVTPKCQSPGTDSPFKLPLKSKYLAQVFSQMNVDM